MRGWVFAVLVCAVGCAPDRYWVNPDDLAKARAAASPTVPAVRVDDNAPARAFVDELSPEAAPPRADGRVMMIAAPAGHVARPLDPAAQARRRVRLRKVLLGLGIPVLVVGGAFLAGGVAIIAGSRPCSPSAFFCIDLSPLGWSMAISGALMHLAGVGLTIGGAVTRGPPRE